MRENIYKPNRLRQFMTEVVCMLIPAGIFGGLLVAILYPLLERNITVNENTPRAFSVSVVLVLLLCIIAITRHINRIIIEKDRIIIDHIGKEAEIFLYKDFAIFSFGNEDVAYDMVNGKRLVLELKHQKRKLEYDFSPLSRKVYQQMLSALIYQHRKYQIDEQVYIENIKPQIAKKFFQIDQNLIHGRLQERVNQYTKQLFIIVTLLLVWGITFVSFNIGQVASFAEFIWMMLAKEWIWFFLALLFLIIRGITRRAFWHKRIENDRKLVPNVISFDEQGLSINSLAILYEQITMINMTSPTVLGPYEVNVFTTQKYYRCVFENCSPSYNEFVDTITQIMQIQQKPLTFDFMDIAR